MHLGKGFVRTLWGKVEALGAIFLAGFCQLLFECIQQVFSKFESIQQVVALLLDQ
jgi:hypothetical protein